MSSPVSSGCMAIRWTFLTYLRDKPNWLTRWRSRTMFGRVRSEQKRVAVRALPSPGHTIVMANEGFNDVLTLKDADIGVKMGAGSSVSCTVAQMVLLDNIFAKLLYVVC
uniref:TraX n=1 Tax=Mycobacterium leprae TaxID=1769 RepID=Q50124_MYCLR|nr:traX [Mycobacterium leprae]